MHRLRHDLDHATSAGLLIAAVLTGITGVVSDAWDLNDFWPHIIAGYLMGGLAIAHVWFNWGRLVAYLRFRGRSLLRRDDDRPPAPPASRRPDRVELADPPPSAVLARIALSRRGLIGAAAGGVAGLVLGRGLRPPPPIPAGSDVGLIYHQWSKPGIVDALGTVANWGAQPELYKAYPGAPRIALPRPDLSGGRWTEEAIVVRRSVRTYAADPMTIEELSRVLFLASGITGDAWGDARRTAPSSGALYPLELYPVVHNVAGVERGVYHYAYREHALELVRPGDHRQAVVDQGLGQEFLGTCGAVVFVSLILQRMRFRYQDRSYRYGLIEAGHVGQNLYLAATSAGLGACAIGAFMDDAINAMLGIDGTDEAAVYLLSVGRVPVAPA
ncbi:MAG TPA: SagB family peptide dehydrogenase [Candidatus Limnocylindrales bacterium]|nr:SagB family peptide dehydrogenase [Candidatus Limnocylindrales bacterium]